MMATDPVSIGVLALQGDVIDHVRILEAAGARAFPVRRPAELLAADGIVLPGGESTTMIKLLRTFDLLQPLRQRVSEGMPTYGSCAGMILLADHVLDGVAGQETVGGLDVTVRRNAFGRQVASFEADVEVEGVDGEPVRAVFIRAPWVEASGEDVHVLAEVDLPEGGRAVVAVRQGDVLATSFHPEMTDDFRLHALFVRMVQAHAARMPGNRRPGNDG